MLTITRRPGEQIHFTGGVTITVHRVRGHAVQITCEAPADVAIVRGELVARGAQVLRRQVRGSGDRAA